MITKSQMEELISQFGSAFYILDSKQFRQNYAELKASFSDIYPNFNIAYSYKTNYTPTLCRAVKELSGYAEVVSEMELELALRVGNPPESIIWNGPIKNPNKMAEFLLSGGTVNLDSVDEAHFALALANAHPDAVLNVGIRCNYDVNDGVVSRFGLDVHSSDFSKVLDIIAKTPNLKLKNYHCHFAKRKLEYWANRANGMLELLSKTSIIPERIDIGGGLYGKMSDSLRTQFSDKIPTYDDYAQVVATQFRDYFEKAANKPELVIEPGSALVGDCMKFAGMIKTIKAVRGKHFASVLGSQTNISMSGVNPPLAVIQMSDHNQHFESLDFVGFTCIEGDVLYRNYCGKAAVGDMVLIDNCGSYSVVMKPPFILPNFPIVDISGGRIELVKRQESFDDVFHTFVI